MIASRLGGRTAARRPARWAAAALALGLAGCPAPENLGPPAEKPVSAETIPVRSVFVATGPTRRNPEAPKRTVAEARARAEQVIARLKAGEAFAKVAAEACDDPMGRAGEGFSGFVAAWLGDREDLVAAAERLAPGEVSGPVEAPDGVYILQRLTREEGKEIEDRICAAVRIVTLPWHELVPSLPASQTREQAYAEMARAVDDIRSGREEEGLVLGRLVGARTEETGIRVGFAPAYDALARAALELQPGHWSDPVETVEGWAYARRLPYARFYLRHVLVAHLRSPGPFRRPQRTPDEAVDRAKEALARLREDPGSWDAVVREYSDDEQSRARGGLLGDVATVESPRRRPPASLVEVGQTLKPGEISEIVPSNLGMHILQRVD